MTKPLRLSGVLRYSAMSSGINWVGTTVVKPALSARTSLYRVQGAGDRIIQLHCYY